MPAATDREESRAPPTTQPTSPPISKKAAPSEEEEGEAPTRLLRSAVKRVKEPDGKGEEEELVVSWSLKLVRSIEGESKGKKLRVLYGSLL